MTLLLPAKNKVRQSFERAAQTYDGSARVQRWVSVRLISGLPSLLTPAVILDAGCGTGFAQEMLSLRFPAAHRIALDFSPAMLGMARQLEFGVVGDVESLPLKQATVGLYWSSLTAQWCDMETLMREAHRVLWPSGALALSTLTTGTYRELEESFDKVDQYRHTLTFLALPELEAACKAAGFTEVRVHSEPCVVYHKTLKAMLRTIKSLGANQFGGMRRTGLMGKGVWKKLESAYETRRTSKGLPLTYQVAFCYARKSGGTET
ncbi:MAG: malonyl-ACP O-methyltransferase BioC [Zoogloeaceae bacterium]|nr:malonyl-ACP O-methyltransferase BioC [Zoogloeaceae bacterium]